MKIDDILLTEADLAEAKIRHAIAGALLAMAGSHIAHDQDVADTTPTAIHQAQPEFHNLVASICDKYKIPQPDAVKVVKLAQKYAKPTFPTTKDILAVIGVESSFRPTVKSGLKHDPAVGYMQIRPKIWNQSKAELMQAEHNIKVGAEILHQYYIKLKNKEHALEAYNVGIKNFLTKKVSNAAYPRKVFDELKSYEIK